MIKRFPQLCSVCAFWIFFSQSALAAFTAFESGHVRPLAMSPDFNQLFVVNTPDNRLEIFTVTTAGDLVAKDSVPVGLEPVAVAARNNSEVWVVNHLSDSISIVDVSSTPPRVVRTLLVGDEPRDIVFAGPGGNRAFITTAHRGQNSPYTSVTDPGELTQPGIGRADVWVFDAGNLGNSLEGTPLTIVKLFGDTPRPLAVSPDGSTVYAGVHHSGNQTTTLHEGVICSTTPNPFFPENPEFCSGGPGDRFLPPPTVDANNLVQPDVGLIVRYDGNSWRDELGRDWNDAVRFSLPDKDVFAINANANPPVETAFYTGVGTILYNIAVSPATGKLFVTNTEAFNEVRFEGIRAPGTNASSVIGHQHETRISIIDPGSTSVTPRHLNKHIDYNVVPSPSGVAQNSLALPRQVEISADGTTLYVAAKGSDKVGIFNVAQLETDSFVPSSANHVHISGGGPAGLLLDPKPERDRLYVTSRFDNGISVIDTNTGTELEHIQLPNPEPQEILTGRRFLYDANLTSSNGEAACASCHVDGDFDSLAWDLGDPDGTLLTNPLEFRTAANDNPPVFYKDFHPMKGPMTTQTLRGMDGHGSMHWRGDRTGGNDEPNSDEFGDGGAFNEVLSFKQFAGAFEGLLGRDVPASDSEMQAFAEFILKVLPPPNPIRNLDNSKTALQAAGETFYFNNNVDGNTCDNCHTLNVAAGFFGTDGFASFEAESQHLKVPHLRNMYTKVGMFGMPAVGFFLPGNNGTNGGPQPPQIRGFGFLRDGSVDSLLRFLNAALFAFPGEDAQRKQVEQFMFAFDSNLKPVVGQQITLTDTNTALVDPRIDLLVARATAGDADLVVKGILAGESRGWWRLSDGTFESDRVTDAPISESALRAQAQSAGQVLTFTAVPPGDGMRIGIDRDEDGVYDADDNCVSAANPLKTDTDNDGLGDACDDDDDNDGLSDLFEQVIGTNSLLVDTDSDGLNDGDEVGYDGDYATYTPGADTNPLVPDTDGDGLDDGVDPIPLTFNVADGDLNVNGTADAGDLLLATRIALGLLPATDIHLAHGDLHPSGSPDGAISLSDVLLLQKLILQ